MNPEADGPSSPPLAAAVKELSERASALFRLEVELATLELQRKGRAFGLGIGFAAGAVIVALYMVGFVFATIAAAIATALPTWAALLIVTGFLLLMAGALAALAVARFKRSTPPLPEQAITEAKLTTEALKTNGR